jgi:threonine dehydrogenase-like Zn-dependent dehydrogenase
VPLHTSVAAASSGLSHGAAPDPPRSTAGPEPSDEDGRDFAVSGATLATVRPGGVIDISGIYEKDEWETDLSYAHRIAHFEYSKRLRTWAAEQGIKMNQRGRIPMQVVEKYTDATGDDIAEIMERINREHGVP